MFEFLRGRIAPKEKLPKGEFLVPSGVEGGPVWQVTDRISFQIEPIYPHGVYMEEAEKKGIRALSLSDIRKALGEDNFGDWVLFDTPPGGLFPGNHWVVADWDETAGTTDLVFSNTSGNLLMEHVRPFKLPNDMPFFTGVTVKPVMNLQGEAISHCQLIVSLEEQPSETRVEHLDQFSFGEEITYWVAGAKPHLRKPDCFSYIDPQAAE